MPPPPLTETGDDPSTSHDAPLYARSVDMAGTSGSGTRSLSLVARRPRLAMGRPLGPLLTDVQNILMGARACAVRKAPLVGVGPGGDRNDERDITGDESRGKQRNSRRQGTCSATRPGVTGTTASGAPSRWTQAEHSGRKARPVTPAGTGSTWRPRDGPSDWPGSVCWLRSCGRRVASSGTRDPGCVNAGRVLGPAPRDSHASPVNNHLQLSGARLRP